MDAKPIIEWAKAQGEARVVERLLVKLLPDLLEHDIEVTAESLNTLSRFDVPETLYNKIQITAEQIVGQTYQP